jgi:tRNA U55 pseudouridine synthase TruB
MHNVLKIDYNYFLIPPIHDALGVVSRLQKLRRSGSGPFILDDPKNSEFEIICNTEICFEEEETEKLLVDDAKNEAEQYHRWYADEREKTQKLQETLKSVQQEKLDLLSKVATLTEESVNTVVNDLDVDKPLPF